MNEETKERLNKYIGGKYEDDMSLYNKLTKKYENFLYKGFEIEEKSDEIVITYSFIGSGEILNPQLFIKRKDFKIDIHSEKINNILFNIGMIEAISYWKASCSPNFIINNYKLTDDQKAWWQKLFYKGLGEFRYRNSIDITSDKFIKFICLGEKELSSETIEGLSGNIIPVGGGKDSTVTLELLKEMENTPFIIDINNVHYQSALNCSYALAYENKDIFEVKRTLDNKLLDLNKKGYLNGHTPLSASIAFIALLASTLLNKKYIVLSNEASANEGTIVGTDINHQYSKSFEFETDFNEYIHKNIITNIEYFSFLRPLSELQIAFLLTKYDKYLTIFKSCNVGSKKGIWCLKCAKCLFVYILINPFLSDEKMLEIFELNLLEDESLLEVFTKLVDKNKNKLFDCIGTRDEISLALNMSISKYNNQNLPYLLNYYVNEIQSSDDISFDKEEYNDENFLPEDFKVILKGALNNE